MANGAEELSGLGGGGLLGLTLGGILPSGEVGGSNPFQGNPIAGLGLALGSAAGGIRGDFLLPLAVMQQQRQGEASQQRAQAEAKRLRLEQINTVFGVLDRSYKLNLPLEKRKILGEQVEKFLPGFGQLFEYPQQDYTTFRATIAEKYPALVGIINATPDDMLPDVMGGLIAGLTRLEAQKQVEGETRGGAADVALKEAQAAKAQREAIAAVLAPQRAAVELDKARVELDTLRAKLLAIPKDDELQQRHLKAQIANLNSQVLSRQDDVEYGKVVGQVIERGFESLTPAQARLYNDKSGDPESRQMRIDVAVEKLQLAEENQMVGIMAGLIKSGVLDKGDQTALLQRIGEVGKIQTERRESAVRDAINSAFQMIGVPPPIQPGLQVVPEEPTSQVAPSPTLPPVAAKGSILTDNVTGKTYRSDGKKWLPQ